MTRSYWKKVDLIEGKGQCRFLKRIGCRTTSGYYGSCMALVPCLEVGRVFQIGVTPLSLAIDNFNYNTRLHLEWR